MTSVVVAVVMRKLRIRLVVLLIVESIIPSFMTFTEAFMISPDNLKSSRSMLQNSYKKKIVLFLAPQQLGSFEELDEPEEERIVTTYDWSDDAIPFNDMWDFQKELVQRHLDYLSLPSSSSTSSETSVSTSSLSSSSGLDSVILLQHTPVYTLGTASDPDFIQDKDRVDIVRMDRGGEVTYHGPGQLVVYPILDLRRYKQDIHWYMRALEEAILLALQSAGVKGATREDDVTGVWVKKNKIAAIGIKARRWITMHGLAVNVETSSLANFEGIVPCGLEGRSVTCVNDHLESPITVQEFSNHMRSALEKVFRIYMKAHSDTGREAYFQTITEQVSLSHDRDI
mmetsp:Transcript_1761/g.2459  ORF Transcript_1761/g.2459 Transcript_1761/m.2459 type:complete len:341 (+) Transcript_1761:145-1167(+)